VFRVAGSGRGAFAARSARFVRALSASGGVLFSWSSLSCGSGAFGFFLGLLVWFVFWVVGFARVCSWFGRALLCLAAWLGLSSCFLGSGFCWWWLVGVFAFLAFRGLRPFFCIKTAIA
jgi:hypothetical protein